MIDRNIKLPSSFETFVPLRVTDEDEWEITIKRLSTQLKCPVPALPPQPTYSYPSIKPLREEDSSKSTGFQVAIANHADHVLGNLPKKHQQIVPRIFLRLIEFGEGRAHSRRQQSIDSLLSVNDDPRIFKETIGYLAANCLLTLSIGFKDTKSSQSEYFSINVELAHEAIIASWLTLQEWLEQRQEAEQTRRRLMLKVEEWERLGRGDGGLLDEVELAEVRRWLDSADASAVGYSEALNELVEVSDRVIQDAQEQEEETIQREFQLLHKRIYQQTKTRRITSIAAVSTAVTLLTLSITLLFGRLGWQNQLEPQTDVLYQFSLTQTALKKHSG